MPGSFDKEMRIEHGCLKPSGPLGLADGETVLRLDFWIIQDGAACMGFLPGPEGEMDERPPGNWRMTARPPSYALWRGVPARCGDRDGVDGQGKC